MIAVDWDVRHGTIAILRHLHVEPALGGEAALPMTPQQETTHCIQTALGAQAMFMIFAWNLEKRKVMPRCKSQVKMFRAYYWKAGIVSNNMLHGYRSNL